MMACVKLDDALSKATGRADAAATGCLAELQVSALFQPIFEHAAIGIIVAGCDGRLVSANPAFCAMLGYGAEELIGQPPTLLLPPEEADDDAPASFERRCLRKDGTAIGVAITRTTLRDRNGLAFGVAFMVQDLTASRQAEARCAASERIYRNLFESTGEAVFVVDADTGVILDANPAACELVGRPVREIVGMFQWDLHPADDQDRCQELFTEYTRHAGVRYGDQVIQRKDGRLVTVEIGSGSICAVDGRRIVVCILRDTSADRAAERALRRSERRYRDMIEATSEGFLQLDRGGAIVEVNDALCQMLGCNRHQVLGRSPLEFVAPGGSEALCAQIAATDRQRHRIFDQVFRARNGRAIITRMHATTLFDDFGHVTGSFAMVADLTELKEREAALAKSEAGNRAIVETAVDAIITIDTRGIVLSVNPAAERLLGYRAEEFIGHTISRIIPEPHATRHTDYIDRYLHDRQKRVLGIGREVMARRRDGSLFPVSLSISEIDLPGFHVFVGMIRNITEEKRAERALIEAKEASDLANRAKGAFLSNMTHELRTPLNGILGFAEIIAQQMLGPIDNPEYRIYAAEIKRSGETLLANINDILDMATIEAGQIDLDMELVDFRDIVHACLRLIAKRAERARLHVHTDIGAELPPLQADPGALKQVLLHLLSNAIKFTPENGAIGVSARLGAEGDLVIEVFDTGIGIPADRLENVLQAFVLGDSSLTRRFEGIGLGLSISKSLVEMHGGRLAIRSTEGKGTTVTIRLPRERFVTDW